ncbi:hypothetical protein O181_040125 [Austropuccinia psidii MF-1]|uniref:Uncharacterized protein n=1 Tax=Austropuccinia psidii MF-1 TaxID=1389203 RepID=A0A9Q3HFU0_9BASI|nr:hypothetical protein [Austropuccinia psidii MF-1]
MKALTFEPYSDVLRFLNPNTGKVKISCDYVQLRSETSVIMRKAHGSLPESPMESQHQPVTVILPPLGKIHTSHPNQVPHHKPAKRLMLADVVTYKQAMSNPVEEKAWQQTMQLEYNSLMNHNTGDLVPYPPNGTKVIGGMWRLTQKQN